MPRLNPNSHTELGSVHARNIVDTLMYVHALMNMYRVSGNEEYREGAAQWIPVLETAMKQLKHELTKKE